MTLARINKNKKGYRNASRVLRLLQTHHRLPRHHKRGRLCLHLRGAPLRQRLRHRARRSGLESGREQGGDRARQSRVGGQGSGAEEGQGGEEERRWREGRICGER